ncbi:MAG: Integral membrane protein [Burkholderiaceae bacterium]|jgi:YjbE family integral membrane protein|nr:MAG: Integral membrane protein [Burkholderiaceae bacterium]
MEFFSAAWWSALLAIVLIDLVLAGDNAIVIALAARRLPVPLQRRAIIWGTVGAIVVRALMTVGVVWLLRLPGLRLVGGLALLWIAWKLLADGGEKPHDEEPTVGFWGAMRIIVVADALMGIDNVLGVAGAARDSFELVIFGLLVSVPIVVFGSTLVLRIVQRFPVIIVLGALVLGYTAAHMICADPLLARWFEQPGQAAIAARWAVYVLAVGAVLAAAWWQRRRARPG